MAGATVTAETQNGHEGARASSTPRQPMSWIKLADSLSRILRPDIHTGVISRPVSDLNPLAWIWQLRSDSVCSDFLPASCIAPGNNDNNRRSAQDRPRSQGAVLSGQITQNAALQLSRREAETG